MSNYRSEEARQIQQERRSSDRERTLERHAGRVAKMQSRSAFGTVTR